MIIIWWIMNYSGRTDRFDKALNSVAVNTASDIEQEFPYIKFTGIGGSLSKEGVINHETLTFHVNKIINRNEGVEIIYEIVSRYLYHIHSNRDLQFYLKEHPFSVNSINVMLFVYDEQGYDVFHPNLESISLDNGVLAYLTVSRSDEHFYKDETYSEEPFEVAAKRLGVWDGE